MVEVEIDPVAARELIEVGKFAAERGWVPATSGNFSRRLDAKRVLVTRSGADKGALRTEDLAVVDLSAALPAGVSAETPLHLARYRSDDRIGAIVHVHSVAATVLSRAALPLGSLELHGWEMQKALEGHLTHDETIRVPVFANAQDTERLASEIEAALAKGCAVPGYLLAGHGLYAWGGTMALARRHAEGLEFLLRCALEERRFQ